MSTSSATGIVVAEVHAESEQSPDDDSTTTSRQPSATAAAARLPPEGPSRVGPIPDPCTILSPISTRLDTVSLTLHCWQE